MPHVLSDKVTYLQERQFKERTEKIFSFLSVDFLKYCITFVLSTAKEKPRFMKTTKKTDYSQNQILRMINLMMANCPHPDKLKVSGIEANKVTLFYQGTTRIEINL